MMDKLRAWLKVRRKRRLRILAVMLGVCMLVTTCPEILMTSSVFAAENERAGGTDWTHDENDVLTIKSDAGMEDWINNGKSAADSAPEEIKSIVIENGVTSIGENAFARCSNLVSASIPSSVTSIGKSAFYDCPFLKGITIPSGVTTIGEKAFFGCKKLTSITIPSSVTSMGNSAFEECIGLESVTIESDVTAIEDRTFYGCEKLTSITLPSSVTKIGESAFSKCGSLTSITLPGSVTAIGSQAFYFCTGLTKVEMLRENPPTLGNNAFEAGFLISGKKGILVPVGKADIYKSAAGWDRYADYITDGTPQITGQPENRTVQNGNTASFSVTADGEGTLSYQWQVDRKNGSFADIEHAASFTYTTPAVDVNYNGYKYRCVVTNDRGTATSSEVTLSVSGIHTVTYDYSANGGTSATKTSDTVTVGAQIDLSPTASLTGWEFVGWNTNKSARSGLTSLTMGESDVTLYAIYKKETVITCYSGSAGEYVTSKAVQYNNSAGANVAFPEIKKLNVSGLSGYQACGWQLGKISVGDSKTIYEAGKTIAFSKLPQTDWNGLYQKEITVSYDANGGSGEVPESRTTTTYAIVSKDQYTLYTRSVHAVELPEGSGLSRPGYTFNGWIEGQTTGTSIAAGKKVSPTADTVYYASWMPNSYTVTLQPNGGTGTVLTSYTYGTGATLPTDWTKTGYDFAGWYDNKDCTGTAVTKIPANATGDKVYWAKWTGGGSGDSGSSGGGSSGSGSSSGGSSGSGESANQPSKEAGTVSKDVEKNENAPDTRLSGSEKDLADIILTEEEKAKVENGTDIRLVLDVKDAPDIAGSGDKAVVEKTLSENTSVQGYDVGQYLDISLYKVVGTERSAIFATSKKLTVVIAVPDGLKSKDSGKPRTFAVIRVHDGVAEVLKDLDDDVDTITIETDRFSAYAIVYKEEAEDAGSNTDPAKEASAKEKREIEIHSGLKTVQSKKALQITWGSVSGADGYNVYAQYCGKKFDAGSLNQVTGGKKTKITVKKINGKKVDTAKKIKVYVVAWQWKNGKKTVLAKTLTMHIAGEDDVKFTNVRSIQAEKTSYTLKAGGTVTLYPKAVLYEKQKKQLSDKHAKEFRYLSSNKNVATVTAGGKITAKGPGSCTIYIFARNGCCKKIKIKVKE